MECEYESFQSLLSSDARCELARTKCNFEFINFMAIHYCVLDEIKVLTFFINFLSVSLSFFIIYKAANNYLSNAITVIGKIFHFSYNLAGVTLVAFGNGAPDVISAILTSNDDSESLAFALSTLFGGMITVSLTTFTFVVFFQNNILVQQKNFIRDVAFSLLAMGVLAIFIAVKEVNIWMSLGFFCIYVFYLIVVVMFEDGTNLEQHKELENLQPDSILTDSEVQKHSGVLIINDDYISSSSTQRVNALTKENLQATGQSVENVLYFFRRFYFQTSDNNFSEMGIFYKIFFVLIEFPIEFLQSLTIPPAQEEQWNRRTFIVIPWFSTAFFLFTTGTHVWLENLYIAVTLLTVLTALSAIIFFTTYRGRMPHNKLAILSASVVMSIVWIWATTNNLVDSVEVAL